MQIMLSIYLNPSTCKYLSLDNGVTMTSKRRENINLVSFICLSFSINFVPKYRKRRSGWNSELEDILIYLWIFLQEFNCVPYISLIWKVWNIVFVSKLQISVCAKNGSRASGMATGS